MEPAFLPDPGGLMSVELLRLSWLSKSSAARCVSDPIARRRSSGMQKGAARHYGRLHVVSNKDCSIFDILAELQEPHTPG